MSSKTTQTTITLLKVGVIAILCAIVMFIIAWWPVIDRVARPCHYYPNAFADCRNESR